MRNTTNILILTLSLSLVGCGSETPHTPPTPPTPEVKPPAPVVDTSEENISTGNSEHVETISIAGSTFRVSVKGSIAPNAEIDVSIVQTSGTPTGAIRVWVGDESGIGSMKIRVHSHGARSHARPKAPATLPENCALWIEVQRTDGTSESGVFALPI